MQIMLEYQIGLMELTNRPPLRPERKAGAHRSALPM